MADNQGAGINGASFLRSEGGEINIETATAKKIKLSVNSDGATKTIFIDGSTGSLTLPNGVALSLLSAAGAVTPVLALDSSNNLLLNSGSTSPFQILVNNIVRWSFDSSGNFSQDATSGGNIVFGKALTGVVDNIGTLAGAGTTISDAAVVATTVCRVTGANGTVGVKLPPLASITPGTEITIINSDVTNLLKVYSNAAGELITGQAGSTAISLAAKLWLRCKAYDATHWYAEKGVTPY